MTAMPPPSPAVLADDEEDWKLDHFSYEILGCRHRFEFPVVKLLECADRITQLDTDPK